MRLSRSIATSGSRVVLAPAIFIAKAALGEHLTGLLHPIPSLTRRLLQVDVVRFELVIRHHLFPASRLRDSPVAVGRERYGVNRRPEGDWSGF